MSGAVDFFIEESGLAGRRPGATGIGEIVVGGALCSASTVSALETFYQDSWLKSLGYSVQQRCRPGDHESKVPARAAALHDRFSGLMEKNPGIAVAGLVVVSPRGDRWGGRGGALGDPEWLENRYRRLLELVSELALFHVVPALRVPAVDQGEPEWRDLRVRIFAATRIRSPATETIGVRPGETVEDLRRRYGARLTTNRSLRSFHNDQLYPVIARVIRWRSPARTVGVAPPGGLAGRVLDSTTAAVGCDLKAFCEPAGRGEKADCGQHNGVLRTPPPADRSVLPQSGHYLADLMTNAVYGRERAWGRCFEDGFLLETTLAEKLLRLGRALERGEASRIVGAREQAERALATMKTSSSLMAMCPRAAESLAVRATFTAAAEALRQADRNAFWRFAAGAC